MGVQVTIPAGLAERLVAKATKRATEAILAVANQVPAIILQFAMERNQDAFGNQMPAKQPRPKNNPKNHPDIPLFDKGVLSDLARWSNSRVSLNRADVIYQKTPYHDALVEKPIEEGGRPWLMQGKVNPNAMAQIEAKMVAAARKALR